MSVPAIELQNITKTFGHIVANKNVNLVVNRGEILSILGENGSGKTTLMNMISGIYYPDNGRILIDGEEVVIRSPKDAFRYKIGMIHQHFKLVDVFSAADNIVLGLDEKFNMKEASAKVARIAAQYGFDIDPAKKIYEMSVSEKQTVEIIKVLYRGADILILDEPTAVLTPQETEKLFSVLRRMKADGKAIIIITHKLHEVLSLSDKVAVLRKGEYIGTVETKDATETSLTEMMVGKKVSLNIDRSEPHENEDRLTVRGTFCEEKAYGYLAEAVKMVAAYPKIRVINVQAYDFNDAGSSLVQELAFGVAIGNEYIAKLGELGIGAEEVARRMKFTFGISSNYFMEIAKFRAARVVWANIVRAWGVESDCACKMHVHAVTSQWNQTVYDAYVNMLRDTTETMSAAIAGVDSIEVLPFDHAFRGNPHDALQG